MSSPPRADVTSSAEARAWWQRRFADVRAHTGDLASSLSPEDQCVQSMPDASPVKWHLAHTTWFFETVVLSAAVPDHAPFDRAFSYLFNSYYEALGPRHPRPQRGLITRPAVEEVLAYRAHVDTAVHRMLQDCDDAAWARMLPALELGLHHEQQHQELILTDVLHLLSCNPLLPAYERAAVPALRLATPPAPVRWIERAAGLVEIGHAAAGDHGDDALFAFDNESPRHQVLLHPHALAHRLVSCGDYARFIEDGGYRRPELWLSDGWARVRAQAWQAPTYWLAADDPRLALSGQSSQQTGASAWHVFGLNGVRPMDDDAPVAHLSFYEAAAYAEWAGARLPTEMEWEAAFADTRLQQMTGQVWQWTRSSYDPYPGFRPAPGIAAEYNGKFMVGQVVLRGSSMATPPGHTRPTYRNFFPPAARWQFSGLRLAKDLA
ncbi:ergothioneine biosynthesis protein EgtB [Xylophilus ampelinus]|uniref:ergothioneine biosynthesis protein EgtB n=1 Tax=Xylophilus ampelinus TaxID=54067 RepID=UPI000D7C7C44|nr:ergothioneine biosynthesis protein EgtB [Xylophilus ampelinus]